MILIFRSGISGIKFSVWIVRAPLWESSRQRSKSCNSVRVLVLSPFSFWVVSVVQRKSWRSRLLVAFGTQHTASSSDIVAVINFETMIEENGVIENHSISSLAGWDMINHMILGNRSLICAIQIIFIPICARKILLSWYPLNFAK